MRRKFIAAIGGVAAMPFVATAQQTARIPRVLDGRAEGFRTTGSNLRVSARSRSTRLDGEPQHKD